MDPNFKKFKQGEFIFREGNAGKDMYIIRNGRVRICKQINDQTVQLSTLERNDFFGEMALLTGEGRSADAVAEEDTEVLEIDKGSLDAVLETVPKWVSSMVRGMAQRLHRMDARIGQDLIYKDTPT